MAKLSLEHSQNHVATLVTNRFKSKLGRTIGIAGVGNGANVIRYNYAGPIAIPTEEGPLRLYNLSAGIVE